MKDLSEIPLQREINDLYEFLNLKARTYNPSFFIVRHEEIIQEMPLSSSPFRNDFFEVSIVLEGGELEYAINDKRFQTGKQYVVMTSPGQVHQWKQIRQDIKGFVLFFKRSFFDAQSTNGFFKDFPFFNINEANLFQLNEEEADALAFYYRQMYQSFGKVDSQQNKFILANLEAVLWFVNTIYLKHIDHNESKKAEHTIIAQFKNLISENFLEKRSVNEYADLLNITPNHLTQVVKKATGRNAKSFIDERLMLEARYMLRYTEADIKEISYKLSFSEPPQFHKFFRKHEGATPSEYRQSQ
ncbi:MAG: helix-turn-helix transcriptional regulator [Cyclobacteriaceae bacterium]|nr:helix-turn-helix transcriptional regulator [Cyclobacteriaceae bacterium HetDA_MAG_MS6]